MSTMQEVVDMARQPLNDDDKVRWTDAQLLAYANAAILFVRKKRPDLFLGDWSSLPSGLALAGTFPVVDEYLPIVANYVTARASLRDDEQVDAGRVAAFHQNFERELVSL